MPSPLLQSVDHENWKPDFRYPKDEKRNTKMKIQCNANSNLAVSRSIKKHRQGFVKSLRNDCRFQSNNRFYSNEGCVKSKFQHVT